MYNAPVAPFGLQREEGTALHSVSTTEVVGFVATYLWQKLGPEKVLLMKVSIFLVTLLFSFILSSHSLNQHIMCARRRCILHPNPSQSENPIKTLNFEYTHRKEPSHKIKTNDDEDTNSILYVFNNFHLSS